LFPQIIASFLLTPFLPAQDTDEDVDDAIQEATESAKKMGVKMPNVKKQFEEVDKGGERESCPTKAVRGARAGGASRLDSKIPQFKPAGPVSKKSLQ
jgi:hypothetical protein